MFDKILILTFFALFITIGNTSLAPFITPCKGTDSECITKSTQKALPIFAEGIPELNVDQLDPLKIASIDASSPNLKLLLTDIVLIGLKNCKANKVAKDLQNFKLFINLECNAELNSNYDMNGKISVLPIEGNGNLHATLRGFVVDVEVDWADKVGKDGKKHWAVKGWKHTFELKDKCDVKFDNLFPGNELLRKTTNEFIASNGNDIVLEVGPPIVQYLVLKVVEDVKNFFKKVPAEDLALD